MSTDTLLETLVSGGHKNVAKSILIDEYLREKWAEARNTSDLLVDLNPQIVLESVSEEVALRVTQKLNISCDKHEVLLFWLTRIVVEGMKGLLPSELL